VIGSSQRPLPDNTQQSQETDTHAPGGIRTRNPSKQAAVYPRFRPRGHWDRPMTVINPENLSSFSNSHCAFFTPLKPGVYSSASPGLALKHTCICKYIHIHTYVHMRMRAYTHTHTHTHTHTICIPYIQNLEKATIGCEICHTNTKYRVQEYIQLVIGLWVIVKHQNFIKRIQGLCISVSS
jgi:hypothetical protein